MRRGRRPELQEAISQSIRKAVAHPHSLQHLRATHNWLARKCNNDLNMFGRIIRPHLPCAAGAHPRLHEPSRCEAQSNLPTHVFCLHRTNPKSQRRAHARNAAPNIPHICNALGGCQPPTAGFRNQIANHGSCIRSINGLIVEYIVTIDMDNGFVGALDATAIRIVVNVGWGRIAFGGRDQSSDEMRGFGSYHHA